MTEIQQTQADIAYSTPAAELITDTQAMSLVEQFGIVEVPDILKDAVAERRAASTELRAGITEHLPGAEVALLEIDQLDETLLAIHAVDGFQPHHGVLQTASQRMEEEYRRAHIYQRNASFEPLRQQILDGLHSGEEMVTHTEMDLLAEAREAFPGIESRIIQRTSRWEGKMPPEYLAEARMRMAFTQHGLRLENGVITRGFHVPLVDSLDHWSPQRAELHGLLDHQARRLMQRFPHLRGPMFEASDTMSDIVHIDEPVLQASMDGYLYDRVVAGNHSLLRIGIYNPATVTAFKLAALAPREQHDRLRRANFDLHNKINDLSHSQKRSLLI